MRHSGKFNFQPNQIRASRVVRVCSWMRFTPSNLSPGVYFLSVICSSWKHTAATEAHHTLQTSPLSFLWMLFDVSSSGGLSEDSVNESWSAQQTNQQLEQTLGFQIKLTSSSGGSPATPSEQPGSGQKVYWLLKFSERSLSAQDFSISLSYTLLQFQFHFAVLT